MHHGVVVIDKPGGATSHDVVERVRRFTRPSRVGHTGTLDPLATGVLVVCVGAATRLARFLTGATKEYTGEIVLGIRTDSYDAQGAIVEERPADGIGVEAVRAAAAGLTGDLMQVPPPWSAKKVDGERAYALARAGCAREPAACRVRVDSFEILGLEERRASFHVACGGGTYVRSLAEDLGRLLGCGAHLAALRRVRNGAFPEAEALPLAAVEEAAGRGRLEEMLRPIEALDLGMPTAYLSEEGERHAALGRAVRPIDYTPAEGVPSGMVRLIGPSGRLLGIAEASGPPPPALRPCVVLVR